MQRHTYLCEIHHVVLAAHTTARWCATTRLYSPGILKSDHMGIHASIFAISTLGVFGQKIRRNPSRALVAETSAFSSTWSDFNATGLCGRAAGSVYALVTSPLSRIVYIRTQLSPARQPTQGYDGAVMLCRGGAHRLCILVY